jgi:hypothetical protein
MLALARCCRTGPSLARNGDSAARALERELADVKVGLPRVMDMVVKGMVSRPSSGRR